MQKLLIKQKKIKKSYFSLKTVLFTRRWKFYKLKYKNTVLTKKYFKCLFDQALSQHFYKKIKSLNPKLNKLLNYLFFILKPEFRLDIFLWRLHFFSSCHQSRNAINNKQILINGKKTHPNYYIKKGDIVTFKCNNFFKQPIYKNNLKLSFVNTFLMTFVEFDFYTNTIVILKNVNDLNENDIFLLNNSDLNISNINSIIY